jgi:hypothetical protein
MTLNIFTFALCSPVHSCPGRCKIADTESFLELRKLTGLRSLTAKENPCAQGKAYDDYNAFIFAYLGRMLFYFDYRVVDDENVAACREQFQNELESLEAAEAAQLAKEKKIKAEAEANARFKAIYMLEAVTL